MCKLKLVVAANDYAGLDVVVLDFTFRPLLTEKRELSDNASGRQEQSCPVSAWMSSALRYSERILAYASDPRCDCRNVEGFTRQMELARPPPHFFFTPSKPNAHD